MTSFDPNSSDLLLGMLTQYRFGVALNSEPQTSAAGALGSPETRSSLAASHSTDGCAPVEMATSSSGGQVTSVPNPAPMASGPSTGLGLAASSGLEPIQEDSGVPFYYWNMLQAGLGPNELAHSFPFSHEGPRPTMTACSSTFSDAMDAFSAFSCDSRPQTTGIKSESEYGSSFDTFAFCASPDRSPSMGELPPWSKNRPSIEGRCNKPSQYPPFGSLDAAAARTMASFDKAYPAPPPPTSWGLDTIPDMRLDAMTLREQRTPSCKLESPTSERPGQNWSTGDSLATWLNHDLLSDLLDEVKGEHPGPLSEDHEDASSHQVHTKWPGNLYRRRRNAIAQLPLLVSCGVLSAMVTKEPESGSDITQSSCASSSSDDDVFDEDEDEYETFTGGSRNGSFSPFSRPLSPTACPLSPKSSRPKTKAGRSSSCSDVAELPEMHRTLSSWNFACRTTGRYRSSSSATKSGKRDKQDAVRDAAAKASKATALSAKRRRPRGKSQGECPTNMDLDDDASDEAEAEAGSEADEQAAKASTSRSTTEATSKPTPAKPKRTSSKSSGKSFSIMSRIVLRPRPGTEDEETSYPCMPETLDEAKLNSGPSHCGEGEDAKDESASLFPSDLYAPRHTRRGPNGREGWCSLCTEGGWYSMKRSQYLYHLQYDHGISSLTRKLFHPPTNIRVWNDAVEKTEGLCHHCKTWVPICFGPVRKRDFKAWFKHAHKCHRDKTGCPI